MVKKTYLYFNYLIFLILLISIPENSLQLLNYGAYDKVPDSSKLQYRLGNGLGYIGGFWDDAKMSNLSRLAGYDTQRKKLSSEFI